MNVKQLKEALNKYPDEMPVCYEGAEGEGFAMFEVEYLCIENGEYFDEGANEKEGRYVSIDGTPEI